MIKTAIFILGAATGAFAYHKYQQLTDEDKERMKEKAKKFGQEVKDSAKDLGNTINEEFGKFTASAKQTYKEATQ